MECDGSEQLRFRSSPETADVPFMMRTLVGIDIGVVILKTPGELKPLNDVVLIVLVPVGKFPDLVESLLLAIDGRIRLRLGRANSCPQQHRKDPR
jgi:hypothetical protein